MPPVGTPPIRSSFYEYILPILPAAAATAHAASDNDDDCVGDSAPIKGIKIFLGINDERTDKYTVAVGSYKDRAVAAAKAKQLNSADPTLKARVGKRACSSEYFPIVVGDPTSIDQAKKILDKANDAASIGDGFLIPGAR